MFFSRGSRFDRVLRYVTTPPTTGLAYVLQPRLCVKTWWRDGKIFTFRAAPVSGSSRLNAAWYTRQPLVWREWNLYILSFISLNRQLFHRPQGRLQDDYSAFPFSLFVFFFMSKLKITTTDPVLLLFAQDINHFLFFPFSRFFSFHHMGARWKDGWGLQRWWVKKQSKQTNPAASRPCRVTGLMPPPQEQD